MGNAISMTDERHLNILGYTYSVDTSREYYRLEHFGTMNPRDQVISVANDLCLENQTSTLLHEMIEAMNVHMGLGFEEDTILRLETALFQVLTANGLLDMERVKEVLGSSGARIDVGV